MVLLAVCASLSGCRSGVTGTQTGTVLLPQTFQAQAAVRYGELEVEGDYYRSVSGESSLRLRSPEHLKGVTLVCSEGELTAEYEEMGFTVNAAAQPDTAVLELLTTTLEAFSGRSFELPGGQGPYQLTMQNGLGRIQAVVEQAPDHDGQFIPQQISIDRLDFQASFEGKASS